MKVLFVAAEVNPLAKVGGLADVAGSLPLALKKLGADIRIVLPKYDVINEEEYPSKLIARDVEINIGKNAEKINIYQMELGKEKVPTYLIDNDKYLGNGGVYKTKTAFCDSFAEIQRFLFFSKAILPSLEALGWQPEIIHCNDWHTAFISVLAKIYFPQNKTKFLYTIHNLANQGCWKAKKIFDFLGIEGDEIPSLKEKATGLYGEDLNLMQQGILNADFVSTVSPTYAKEILTKPYFARGLMKTLNKKKDKFVGILNGLDTEKFDPTTDPFIKTNYSSAQLAGKKENKIYLEKKFNLEIRPDFPLFALISRLTFQKGIDLVVDAFSKIIDSDFQVVFLGTGEAKYEQALKSLAKKFSGKIAGEIKFDAHLAQEIYAGADFFLVPSKFEPCGLTQLIALRYGTIPIVRKTGGLADTVENIEVKKKFLGLSAETKGNGFVFREYSADRLAKTLQRAMAFYQNKKLWRRLKEKVMKEDHSWQESAHKYLNLYQRIIEN